MENLKYTWEGVQQPPDEASAGTPWFHVITYRKAHDGLIMLLEEMKQFDSISEELALDASPYEEEKQYIQNMIKWGEVELSKRTQNFDSIYLPSVSYRSLRYLKAGIFVHVKKYEEQLKLVLDKRHRIPRTLILAFEEKIKGIANIAEMGLMNGLRPAEVFFDLLDCSLRPYANNKSAEDKIEETASVKCKNESRTPIVIKDSIHIVDPELRERCLQLMLKLNESGQQKQLDTIVREMSAVLENRIKQVSNLSGKTDKSGEALVGEVFKVDDPILEISENKSVQQSALLLYKGFFGFVRNEVMHNIVASYTKERVLQLLGFVDYLLSLLANVKNIKS